MYLCLFLCWLAYLFVCMHNQGILFLMFLAPQLGILLQRSVSPLYTSARALEGFLGFRAFWV